MPTLARRHATRPLHDERGLINECDSRLMGVAHHDFFPPPGPAVLSRPITHGVIGLLIGGLLLLTAVMVLGWRHRHAGTVGHEHGHDHGYSHSHGHDHSHSHGHSHSHHHGHAHRHDGHADFHGREGWHVHISLLGLELTLWEPHWGEAVIAEEVDEAEPERDGEGGVPMLAGATPISAGWVSLFWIDPAPVPARTRVPVVDTWARSRFAKDILYLSRVEAPPVPPPRNV